MAVQIKFLDNAPSQDTPKYATQGSAGVDLRAAVDEMCIKPSTTAIIPTGISIAVPVGYEAQVRSRSGLAAKHSVIVLNAPGTIDSDYRGEIKVIMTNLGQHDFHINKGDRIAQLVLTQYSSIDFIKVDTLNVTQRNQQGFGSTGIQ
ncbi:dUTP diphosphatase [Candidatus Sneabacter namystus]|uniref:Deoxyuridine 5'-triphosphate nucleotidohydrolase n=1 Tax=Candidatus Sneabacter namystus TaxID=2601646 RepID=A0A5C0ULU9_9RICK|nr:dUTP diphosphatase [Candidatus Sneabacter namystus]QEK39874.1 dUTP diphosphatase [Candidatus Sneabacter namystus]